MGMPAYNDDYGDEEPEAPEAGVADITEAEKYEFLQMIRMGYDRREAAFALGYKARPWRSLTSRLSPFYDEEFTISYNEAVNSLEAQLHFADQIREEVKRRALTDSDRLLEKLAMVHLPEFAVLRQKDLHINVHAVLEQTLKGMPTELVQQFFDALDRGEITDAEIVELPELPPAGSDGDAE